MHPITSEDRAAVVHVFACGVPLVRAALFCANLGFFRQCRYGPSIDPEPAKI